MDDLSVPPLSRQGLAMRQLFGDAARGAMAYTRLEVDPGPGLPDGPALIILNHGFGTFTDLNVLAAVRVFQKLGYWPHKPAVMLAHTTAWKLGLGQRLEVVGLREAGNAVALQALSEGKTVFVLPGGDVDATKSWVRRNDVVFGGRSGFARLAQEAGVPIVPIVVTGAGDTLISISDGRRIASALGLDKLARQKTLPISFALPWGLNLGIAAGVYLPWPAKIRARVLAPVTVAPTDDAETAARDIERAMNDASHALTRNRNPYLDWLTRPAR